jgi:hypothetical protein
MKAVRQMRRRRPDSLDYLLLGAKRRSNELKDAFREERSEVELALVTTDAGRNSYESPGRVVGQRSRAVATRRALSEKDRGKVVGETGRGDSFCRLIKASLLSRFLGYRREWF